LKAEGAYKSITAALRKAGRPIVLSICEWGSDKPWLWGQTVGHLWRTTGDIYDCFDCIKDHGSWKAWGVMQILDKQEGLRQYAGPGHWNDPDMLEVGNGGLSVNQNRAHFSMWAMLAAPLIAGNDLRNMSAETKAILTNKEVIAVNQDSLGIQALKYTSKDSVEIWAKPLKGDDWAVCFLNRSVLPKQLAFNWQKEIINDDLSKRILNCNTSNYVLRDLWLKKETADTKKPVNTVLPAHDVLMVRLIKK
ncbi:MAG: glycoside hydrolase family 27 protein, partial [Chitinophagaceae bacterium]